MMNPLKTHLGRSFRIALYFYAVCFPAILAAQFARSGANEFSRPLDEMLEEVEHRFDVRIGCKRFAADTVSCPYADFRVRPYSLAETLDNLLRPLDLKWSAKGGKITVQPYEYYRRTPADGEKLLAWLSSRYTDRAAWERRRDEVLAGVREALALKPFEAALVANPDVRMGAVVHHDGYTTQNYALETLPGLYVCGTIYASRVRGRRALVIAPSGHWAGGRYHPDHQLLMATLARMGAVAVDLDIFGWGDSERQIGSAAHTSDYSMQLQALWPKCLTDWIVRTRRDIDTTRMAATGGSGGATHAMLLAVLDSRFSALAPVVHLVSHFDGGCPCESGRPVTLAAGGSCTPEILAAAMVPRPVLTVSDGGDWTASYPELEYPYLRRIWALYGAEEAVENAHFPEEGHDYGPNKRQAVYDFFARRLRLDASQVDESKVELLPASALSSFADGLPAGAIASREELERMLETTNIK